MFGQLFQFRRACKQRLTNWRAIIWLANRSINSISRLPLIRWDFLFFRSIFFLLKKFIENVIAISAHIYSRNSVLIYSITPKLLTARLNLTSPSCRLGACIRHTTPSLSHSTIASHLSKPNVVPLLSRLLLPCHIHIHDSELGHFHFDFA